MGSICVQPISPAVSDLCTLKPDFWYPSPTQTQISLTDYITFSNSVIAGANRVLFRIKETIVECQMQFKSGKKFPSTEACF